MHWLNLSSIILLFLGIYLIYGLIQSGLIYITSGGVAREVGRAKTLMIYILPLIIIVVTLIFFSPQRWLILLLIVPAFLPEYLLLAAPSLILTRIFLCLGGFMPWNCKHFLDYAAERILLRKVDNRYIFVHRLLQDYFASLKTKTTTSAKH
jgi:hypothetical protein